MYNQNDVKMYLINKVAAYLQIGETFDDIEFLGELAELENSDILDHLNDIRCDFTQEEIAEIEAEVPFIHTERRA